MILLVFILMMSGIEKPIVPGMITYLALSFALRFTIPKHHRKGIKYIKKKMHAEAIDEFLKSYDFFSKHEWIDRFRYITIFSSSIMCYREMALANIAFCYSQIGNGEKAIDYYKQVLSQYPGNQIAEAGLNMIESRANVQRKK